VWLTFGVQTFVHTVLGGCVVSVWPGACIFTPLMLCFRFHCSATDIKDSHRHSLSYKVFQCVEMQNTAMKLTLCRIYAWTAYWISLFYEACIESSVEILRCCFVPTAFQFSQFICSCQNACWYLLVPYSVHWFVIVMVTDTVAWVQYHSVSMLSLVPVGRGSCKKWLQSVNSDYEDWGI
jgi:hypothetical protein